MLKFMGFWYHFIYSDYLFSKIQKTAHQSTITYMPIQQTNRHDAQNF